jgi:hypothetical protein
MTMKRSRVARPKRSRSKINWLKRLDQRIEGSDLRESWSVALAEEGCPTFIIVRYPLLKRRHTDQGLAYYVRTGEKMLRTSKNRDRILGELNWEQTQQLAALVLDIKESMRTYGSYRVSVRRNQELSKVGPRRLKKLESKRRDAQDALESLRKYAHKVGAILGFEYERLAVNCLEILTMCIDELPEKKVSAYGYPRRTVSRMRRVIFAASAYKYLRGLKGPSQQFEEPSTRGLVQLFWFFHHEAAIPVGEAEVKVAMIANDFLDMTLKYVSQDGDAESRGCDAVRKAVERYSPRTNR